LRKIAFPTSVYIQERTEVIVEDDEIETQITLALLLHNYGQVDRCVASIYHADRKTRADVLLEGANNSFHFSRSLLQDLPCPVSPVLSLAIHQTRLDIECDLGLLSSSKPGIKAFSSLKKYQHHAHPTVANHLESPTMPILSFVDEGDIVGERVIAMAAYIEAGGLTGHERLFLLKVSLLFRPSSRIHSTIYILLYLKTPSSTTTHATSCPYRVYSILCREKV
jgi:hypothetical protein